MSEYQAACKVEFQPFNRSNPQLTFIKSNILVHTVYFVSPNPEKKKLHPTQPNQHFNSCYEIRRTLLSFLGFSTRVAVSIIFFTFPPAEVPSATQQPQAPQLDLRRVNERNQKVLSRAVHIVVFGLPKIDGVVREISTLNTRGLLRCS